MRQLLSTIFCLVLVTSLVARGAGVPPCLAAAGCCAATVTPTKVEAGDCCPKPEKPAHPAAANDMPCCASVVWTPAVPPSIAAHDIVARGPDALVVAPRIADALEPATPPPRTHVG